MDQLFEQAILFKDFSFIAERISVTGARHFTHGSSIFDFIDLNGYQLCKPHDVFHAFVAKVKARFGVEYMLWWGGIDSFTGQERTDAAWLTKKAAASTSKEI